MPLVFFSYSWHQKITGARICDLLTQAGASVFRDELGVVPLENFKDRILIEIDRSDYLIVLDSPAARKSTWVPFEITHFIRNGKHSNLIVCLAEKEGEWRKAKEFFDGFNQIIAVECFHRKDGFDPHGVFKRSIGTICEKIGLHYQEEFMLPRRQDFEMEISAPINISSEHRLRKNLLQDYDTIIELDRYNIPSASERLKILAYDCIHLNLKVSTPAIAHCIAVGKSGDHFKALELSEQLIIKNQNVDPRIWSIRAGANYYKGDFEAAEKNYEKAIYLINSSDNQEHEKNLPWVIANLCKCKLQLKKYDEAGLLLMKLDDGFRNSELVSSSMATLIEEHILRFAERKEFHSSFLLSNMLLALFDQYAIAARGLLFTLFYGKLEEINFEHLTARIFLLNKNVPITSEDYYYRGLIHVLTATDDYESLFRKSFEIGEISDRPWYPELVRVYIDQDSGFELKMRSLSETYTKTLKSAI